MRTAWLIVALAGCLDEPEGSLPEEEEDTGPRSFDGTLSVTTDEWSSFPETPAGDCAGTFVVEGPAEGPWCGTGTATCTGGLEARIADEAAFELCFTDDEQEDRATMDLAFVDLDCGANVRTDSDCAYRWEVDISPEALSATIVGRGFCDLEVTSFEVRATRTLGP